MLHEGIRELAKGANFAAITTLLPNGSPHLSVMWVDCDDDHILMNTEPHRRKFRNIERDPRVSVVIWDQQFPYRYAEVRGQVVDTLRGSEARAHIDSLSNKYTGQPYNEAMIQSERVILKIAPDRQVPPRG